MAAQRSRGSSGSSGSIDESVIASVIQKMRDDGVPEPWSADEIRLHGRDLNPDKFKGDTGKMRAAIKELCETWVIKGWMSETVAGRGVRYAPTESGLVEMGDMVPPWIAEAKELIDVFGQHLMDEDKWKRLLRTAMKNPAQRAVWDKVYLPWLSDDNFWLLLPDDSQHRSVNRQGLINKMVPSQGQHAAPIGSSKAAAQE